MRGAFPQLSTLFLGGRRDLARAELRREEFERDYCRTWLAAVAAAGVLMGAGGIIGALLILASMRWGPQ